MSNAPNPAEYDVLGQPLVLPSDDDARRADLLALIEHNLLLTPMERLRKNAELVNFFERVKRIAEKRYKRKIDIEVIGLAE